MKDTLSRYDKQKTTLIKNNKNGRQKKKKSSAQHSPDLTVELTGNFQQAKHNKNQTNQKPIFTLPWKVGK